MKNRTIVSVNIMEDKSENSEPLPFFLYEIWPLVPMFIGLGYCHFTDYKVIPSLLFSYSFYIFVSRLYNSFLKSTDTSISKE